MLKSPLKHLKQQVCFNTSHFTVYSKKYILDQQMCYVYRSHPIPFRLLFEILHHTRSHCPCSADQPTQEFRIIFKKKIKNHFLSSFLMAIVKEDDRLEPNYRRLYDFIGELEIFSKSILTLPLSCITEIFFSRNRNYQDFDICLAEHVSSFFFFSSFHFLLQFSNLFHPGNQRRLKNYEMKLQLSTIVRLGLAINTLHYASVNAVQLFI